MTNKEPTGCEYHDKDADYDLEPADDGADRQDLIRLDEIHKSKGNGAGTSTDTGGPTDALVAPVGERGIGESSETESESQTDNIFTMAAAVPLPRPLPKRAKARTRRRADCKPSMKDYAKQVIVEFCCGEESHMGEAQHQKDGCE
eukprot:7346436-Heterocapsa_arctica.AAC.1